jgi:hypothetical protein
VIPAVMLLATWLTVPLAVLAAAAGIMTGWDLVGGPGPRRPGRPPLTAWLVAGLVTVTTGVLGLTHHSGDWRKHFALLHDLTLQSWPLAYRLDGASEATMSYYAAWYLPAGLVGRLFGWTAANVALTLWLLAGWLLVCWWLAHLVGHRLAPLLLATFAGLDVVGAVLLPLVSGWPRLGELGHSLDVWSGDYQVQSLLRAGFEAAPQVVPAFLVVALGLSGALPRGLRLAAVVALAALSSPFTALTAGVLVLVAGVPQRAPARRPRFAAASAVTVIVVVAFLLTRLAGPPEGVANEVTVGLSLSASRFGAGAGDLAVALAMVLVLEGGLLGGILLSARSALQHDERRLLKAGLALGVVLLLVRVGINHDLAMRGTAPIVFLLAVVAGRQLVRSRRGVSLAVAACLVAGAVTPAVELYRNVVSGPRFEPAYSARDPDAVPGLLELGPRWYPDRPGLLSQYLVADEMPASLLLDTSGG